MKAETCDLSGIIVFTPRRFLDDRGFLCETWNRERMADIGIGVEFVQENQAGAPSIKAMRRITAEHPIEEVGARLRGMMPWIQENRLVDKEVN